MLVKTISALFMLTICASARAEVTDLSPKNECELSIEIRESGKSELILENHLASTPSGNEAWAKVYRSKLTGLYAWVQTGEKDSILASIGGACVGMTAYPVKLDGVTLPTGQSKIEVLSFGAKICDPDGQTYSKTVDAKLRCSPLH